MLTVHAGGAAAHWRARARGRAAPARARASGALRLAAGRGGRGLLGATAHCLLVSVPEPPEHGSLDSLPGPHRSSGMPGRRRWEQRSLDAIGDMSVRI